MTILFELQVVFPEIRSEPKVIIATKTRNIDILISSLSLVIEYDGKYWHRDKMIDDLTATREIESEGYRVLRLREQPLPLLGVDELAFPSSLSFKELVNMTLLWIKASFTLDPRTAESLAAYLLCDGLQNSEAFENYRYARIRRVFSGEKGSQPMSRYEYVRMLLSEDSGLTLAQVVTAWQKGGNDTELHPHVYYHVKHDMGISKKRIAR